MERLTLDAYITDVLMPDLIGHDRRPAAFIVYLFLVRHAIKSRGDSVAMSLQTIATKTGLSKSTVQSAIRHLKRRALLDSRPDADLRQPRQRILRPWVDRVPSSRRIER